MARRLHRHVGNAQPADAQTANAQPANAQLANAQLADAHFANAQLPGMSMSTTPPAQEPDLNLAQVLTARIAHDLGSPLGTLAGMLEMLAGGAEDAELLAVVRQAATDLRGRLALQRAAWGNGGEATDRDGLLALLAGSAAAQRVAFNLAGPLFDAPVAAALVPLLLNGALLAAEALPRGGAVTCSATPRDLVFLPEGRNAAWPAETLALLANRAAAPLAAGPRHVVGLLLVALARAQSFDASLMPGMGAGLPALLLTRP